MPSSVHGYSASSSCCSDPWSAQRRRRQPSASQQPTATATTTTGRVGVRFRSCWRAATRLQDAKSEFGVDVGLVGINGPLSRTRQLPVPARQWLVPVVLVLLCGCGLVLLCTRDRKEETKHTMNHYSDNRSVGTYPSCPRSVYSNQNMNHREGSAIRLEGSILTVLTY
jgi:hypothetical protein